MNKIIILHIPNFPSFSEMRIPAIPDTYSCFNRTLSPALTGHRVLLKADSLS